MEPALVRTAVKDAVCHFEDVSYRTRAHDITSAVPELVESVPDLAGKLMAARNATAATRKPLRREATASPTSGQSAPSAPIVPDTRPNPRPARRFGT